jgi:PAS domain S-box-containing protein
MRLRELRDLVASTTDAAFAVGAAGEVVIWNAGAEVLFGIAAADAVGRDCADLIKGSDESGQPVCSSHCKVKQASQNMRRLRNFNLLVETAQGKTWCSTSLLAASANDQPFSIHIILPMDMRTMPARESPVSTGTGIGREETMALVTRRQLHSRTIALTRRQEEVLALLAEGATSRKIAAQIQLSCRTVEHHVHQIMLKLHAHTRLEAIRSAERLGLISKQQYSGSTTP